MIREQLLSRVPSSKERVLEKEGNNSQGSCVADFSGLEPSAGRGPFEKELRKYCVRRCTTVPEIVSYTGPGVIVDCRDPYLQERVLKCNNTPHTNRHTLKVEQPRPPLKLKDNYLLANNDVLKREGLIGLHGGDKTTVTYTLRPFPHKTAVNAVDADARANLNNAEPTGTSVNGVGQPKPPVKKTANPGFKPPPSDQLVPVLWAKHSKKT